MSADAELVAAIARQIVEPIKERLDSVAADAREARDGMLRLTTAIDTQNMGHRVDALSEEMKIQHNALRQDVVLTQQNIKTDLGKLTDRVRTLETDKERREGGLLLVRLAKEYGGWFMGLGAMIVATYGKWTGHTGP